MSSGRGAAPEDKRSGELGFGGHSRIARTSVLKAWFSELGISDVVELDWWETARLGALAFVSVPAQHTSGRTPLDHDARLWSSWVVSGTHERLFFGGDTGYHAGFTEIAQLWGPFDVVALPIGGYSAFQRHHPNHLNPEEAVQAFEDLRGHLLVPMKSGTFETNREPSREPPDRLLREARRRGLEAQVEILSPGQTIHWSIRAFAVARRGPDVYGNPSPPDCTTRLRNSRTSGAKSMTTQKSVARKIRTRQSVGLFTAEPSSRLNR